VTSLLSLFPLDFVLLPGCPLPLHIFEPRYKEMIAECRAQDSSFGIVRIVEKGFADIGCTAEIVSIVKEYPDGRLDIISEGRKRFEVLRVNQERSFPVSYTHLRAHETSLHLVCRLLLEVQVKGQGACKIEGNRGPIGAGQSCTAPASSRISACS